ncbi:MAG: glycoside hydrolase family 2 [Clostridia bacterium]|nr:glycoside hydrolase family 2 [Clostridia bacterium]
MRKSTLIENWKVAIVPHKNVKDGFCATTVEGVRLSNEKIIPAAVPGCYELDMQAAGLLDDPYYADNIIGLQKTEHLHLWYFTEFDFENREGFDAFLSFGGIDTASEIYLDGELVGKTENMFIPHTFPLNGLSDGRHGLVVHIIPAGVYARSFKAALTGHILRYNTDALVIRKAPYMYGWDIMPRAVSAGLWRPVELVYRPKNRIDQVYAATMSVQDSSATVRVTFNIDTEEELLTDFSYKIEMTCGESAATFTGNVFGSQVIRLAVLENPKFWMPKNYGEPNLYDFKLTLYYKGVECDVYEDRIGLRIVELEHTSCSGDDGEFVFRVNGQKIFCLGTNWVPLDAFPCRHAELQPRALRMLDDIGCNMVRCWGGNVYPDEDFFRFCDERGILVWQDFAIACGYYPTDERMLRLFREEAESVVCQFRNHASLALWSGGNECDQYIKHHKKSGGFLTLNEHGHLICPPDFNEHPVTRGVFKAVTRDNDFARPYLPNSPYMDAEALRTGRPAEDHLWGPRDFFKGPYYGTSECHFASETGYHGCPSPETLRKFIPEDRITAFGDTVRCDDTVWLTHAACMEPVWGTPYSYRIPLMSRQVERIFKELPDDIQRYALESQISQAEAKKYFIERFRIAKWRKTGILWWNLIDGWPQISDAIVDWYGQKKLAYSYIKRSQSPFCLMMDEPQDGKLTLVAANDSRETLRVSYTVRELYTGREVLRGELEVAPDRADRVAQIPDTGSAFYLIEWSGDVSGKNHFTAAIGDGIELEKYSECMKQSGFFDALEGFNI